MFLLILQQFDVNITIINKFQVKLINIITPVLIINNIVFIISAILLDILYLPLKEDFCVAMYQLNFIPYRWHF